MKRMIIMGLFAVISVMMLGACGDARQENDNQEEELSVDSSRAESAQNSEGGTEMNPEGQLYGYIRCDK